MNKGRNHDCSRDGDDGVSSQIQVGGSRVCSESKTKKDDSGKGRQDLQDGAHSMRLRQSVGAGQQTDEAASQQRIPTRGQTRRRRLAACRPQAGADHSGGGAPARAETKTNCSQCGQETTVPFRPTQGRPVFCRECFQQRRAAGAPPS